MPVAVNFSQVVQRRRPRPLLLWRSQFPPRQLRRSPESNYPSQRIGSVKDLRLDHPVQISYPDKDSPGVLLKLGRRVEGGVGPEGDVVAFSTLCAHKGYPLAY